MGVDLRGRQLLVAKQFLNASDVGSRIEKMGSEGMPQGVRASSGLYAGPAQIGLQEPPDAATAQPGPEAVHENGGSPTSSPLLQKCLTRRQPLRQSLLGCRA